MPYSCFNIDSVRTVNSRSGAVKEGQIIKKTVGREGNPQNQ